MKKKLFLTLALSAVLCMLFVLGASAATFYVDKDGKAQSSADANTAYEFDGTVNGTTCSVSEIYLHDTTLTTLIIPDFDGIERLNIASWGTELKAYALSDKDTKASELQTQFKVLDIYETIFMDGANDTTGSFMKYTALEKVIFRGSFMYNSRAGAFKSCPNLRELHFYGENINVPPLMTNVLKTDSEQGARVVFHEGSSGTISTGGDTLPTVSDLNGKYTIYINENIKPSNESDPRLGAKWGQVTSTTGWNLIMVVDNLNDYTAEKLEALKTSHGFASRAIDVASAITKEATVTTYCALGYDEHNNQTTVTYNQGYMQDGLKFVGCAKCNSGEQTTLSPLFTSVGYSVSESETAGIAIGYRVNGEAIEIYENATCETVKYGLFATTKKAIGTSDIFDENGTANSNAVTAEISNDKFVVIEIKLTGFTSEDKATQFAFGAFVSMEKDGVKNISYLQEGVPLENEKYYFASYNEIAELVK